MLFSVARACPKTTYESAIYSWLSYAENPCYFIPFANGVSCKSFLRVQRISSFLLLFWRNARMYDGLLHTLRYFNLTGIFWTLSQKRTLSQIFHMVVRSIWLGVQLCDTRQFQSAGLVTLFFLNFLNLLTSAVASATCFLNLLCHPHSLSIC